MKPCCSLFESKLGKTDSISKGTTGPSCKPNLNEFKSCFAEVNLGTPALPPCSLPARVSSIALRTLTNVISKLWFFVTNTFIKQVNSFYFLILCLYLLMKMCLQLLQMLCNILLVAEKVKKLAKLHRFFFYWILLFFSSKSIFWHVLSFLSTPANKKPLNSYVIRNKTVFFFYINRIYAILSSLKIRLSSWYLWCA